MLDEAIPTSLVKMNGVATIDFPGCTFRNTRGRMDENFYDRGTGIFGENSKFMVPPRCLDNSNPCIHLKKCSFEKLNRGIYAMNSGSDNGLIVSNCLFLDNVRGLYASGFSGSTSPLITEDSIRVFRPGGNPIMETYGAYLNECSGYQIEANEFYADGTTPDGIGLIINNSLEEPNQVYRNTFRNLGYGSLAQNRNRDNQGIGLCYKCNRFTQNRNDISVTMEEIIPPISMKMGIDANQGSSAPQPDAPAGNKFDLQPITNHLDLVNDLNPFNYYYHGEDHPIYRFNPTGFIGGIGLVTPYENQVGFNEPQSCPSNLSYGGGDEERSLMNLAEDKTDSISTILEAQVDGGSTETLNTEVQNSTSPEAVPTRDELLANSPYLSDTVMLSATQKEFVLDSTMIRDVLIANTHSAKSEAVLSALENRIVPLPDYMMAEIIAGEDSVSAKEVLEGGRSYWERKRSFHYHKLLRHYKADTTGQGVNDSVAGLLEDRNTPYSLYDLARVYHDHGEYSLSEATMNTIHASFDLTPEELTEHQAYADFLGLKKQIRQDTSAVFLIDDARKEALEQVAEVSSGLPGAWARNILIAAGKISYEEPILYPQEELKIKRKDKYKGSRPPLAGNHLRLYPNPANEFIIVEFELAKEEAPVLLTVSDLTGKKLLNVPLSSQEKYRVIPVNMLQNGIYVVTLKTILGKVKSGKLTITR